MIDSIANRIDGEPYRNAFGVRLPSLFQHVFIANNHDVQEKLRILRQAWENVFSFECLQAIDDTMRKIDQYWPSYHQRQLLAQLNEISIQMARMQKEVEALEREANITTANEKIIGAIHSIAKPTEYQQFKEQLNGKRLSSLKLSEMPLPKQKKYNRNTTSPNGSTFENFPSLQSSSVLLTPSPEPCDRLTPPELTSIGNSIGSDIDFWKSMTKAEEPKMFNFFSENLEVARFFESFEKSTETNPKADILIEQNETSIIGDANRVNRNVKKVQNEVTLFVDLDSDYEITAESYDNFELDIQNETDVEQEAFQADNLEKQIESSSSKRTTPSPPSLEGISDVEPYHKETTKQIKINLINPRFIKEKSASMDKIPRQVKQIKRSCPPTEWETPSISHEIKDSMKNINFQIKPIHRQGVEYSGMCSIM